MTYEYRESYQNNFLLVCLSKNKKERHGRLNYWLGKICKMGIWRTKAEALHRSLFINWNAVV